MKLVSANLRAPTFWYRVAVLTLLCWNAIELQAARDDIGSAYDAATQANDSAIEAERNAGDAEDAAEKAQEAAEQAAADCSDK